MLVSALSGRSYLLSVSLSFASFKLGLEVTTAAKQCHGRDSDAKFRDRDIQ